MYNVNAETRGFYLPFLRKEYRHPKPTDIAIGALLRLHWTQDPPPGAKQKGEFKLKEGVYKALSDCLDVSITQCSPSSL
jgi:hypothetical protein